NLSAPAASRAGAILLIGESGIRSENCQRIRHLIRSRKTITTRIRVVAGNIGRGRVMLLNKRGSVSAEGAIAGAVIYQRRGVQWPARKAGNQQRRRSRGHDVSRVGLEAGRAAVNIVVSGG